MANPAYPWAEIGGLGRFHDSIDSHNGWCNGKGVHEITMHNKTNLNIRMLLARIFSSVLSTLSKVPHCKTLKIHSITSIHFFISQQVISSRAVA